jgi:hypothetical protein
MLGTENAKYGQVAIKYIELYECSLDDVNLMRIFGHLL